MPNWCSNEIKIKCNDAQLKRFKFAVFSPYENNKALLMSHHIAKSKTKEKTPQLMDCLDYNHLTDEASKFSSCMGSKWDILYQDLYYNNGEVELCCDSAWSPPKGGILSLQNELNGAFVSMSYKEPGCDFCGTLVVERDGNIEDREVSISSLFSGIDFRDFYEGNDNEDIDEDSFEIWREGEIEIMVDSYLNSAIDECKETENTESKWTSIDYILDGDNVGLDAYLKSKSLNKEESETIISIPSVSVAIMQNELTCLNVLIENDYFLDAVDKYGNTAIHFALTSDCDDRIIKKVVNFPVSINKENLSGFNPIEACMMAENVDNAFRNKNIPCELALSFLNKDKIDILVDKVNKLNGKNRKDDKTLSVARIGELSDYKDSYLIKKSIKGVVNNDTLKSSPSMKI